jgi:tetratricopeptide (TPR) repeat protein
MNCDTDRVEERIEKAIDLREEAEGLIAADEPAELDEALVLLQSARRVLESDWKRLDAVEAGYELSELEKRIVNELVETFGVTGGACRRKKDYKQALLWYQEGSHLEEKFRLSNTYNSVNTIKWGLKLGQATLSNLVSTIEATREALSKQVDEKSGPRRRDAWAWADLGDCRALLGDKKGAIEAYRRFVSLAGADDPESPLSVLREILPKLPVNHKATHAVKAIVDYLEDVVA